MLGAGPRDAHRVGLLERVGADQMRGHLAGQNHQRNRIHQGIGQAGDRIGCAGPRGHQHNAGLAGGAGIAFRGMGGALLVAHQDMGDAVVGEQRVIDGKHRAAGIAEDMGYALVLERAHHHLSAGQRNRLSDGVLGGGAFRQIRIHSHVP
jgi:hypothetical protein